VCRELFDISLIICYTVFMAKIDEIKEEIGAGTAKVFLDNSSELLVVLGVICIVLFAGMFAFLARVMHNKIKSLKEIE